MDKGLVYEFRIWIKGWFMSLNMDKGLVYEFRIWIKGWFMSLESG